MNFWKRILIAILCVLLGAGCFAGIYFLVERNGKDKEEQSSEEIALSMEFSSDSYYISTGISNAGRITPLLYPDASLFTGYISYWVSDSDLVTVSPNYDYNQSVILTGTGVGTTTLYASYEELLISTKIIVSEDDYFSDDIFFSDESVYDSMTIGSEGYARTQIVLHYYPVNYKVSSLVVTSSCLSDSGTNQIILDPTAKNGGWDNDNEGEINTYLCCVYDTAFSWQYLYDVTITYSMEFYNPSHPDFKKNYEFVIKIGTVKYNI